MHSISGFGGQPDNRRAAKTVDVDSDIAVLMQSEVTRIPF
jgi:hypothetical protein